MEVIGIGSLERERGNFERFSFYVRGNIVGWIERERETWKDLTVH